jgi:hypothetical protein
MPALMRSSSFSIVSSPTFAFSRRFSSSLTVVSRLFSPVSALDRNASRHSDSVAAVTLSSLETVSRSSPFKSRSTASDFLFAVNRPRSSFFRFDIATSPEGFTPKEVSQEIVLRGRWPLVLLAGELSTVAELPVPRPPTSFQSPRPLNRPGPKALLSLAKHHHRATTPM